ncbi:MAG: hypothetical protein P4L22_03375, partial [Candidatus Babeliales bacterium]|nr:hypothetical protein [Candidatus Babeliales bacterium]
LNRAAKFSGANNVSEAKANKQAEDLASILSSLNSSGAAQEGIIQNCNSIFNGLAKYDQNHVLKIISSKIDIKGLQSLCPTQVNTLLAATKK